MAVGNEVTLRVVGRLHDQNICNTLTYKITAQAASEIDILQNLCIVWRSTLESTWMARCSEQYDLVGLKAFNKVGVNKVPGQLYVNEAGVVAEDALPAQIHRIITLYPDGPNPNRIGKVKLSATCASMVDSTDGGVTSAELALMDGLGAQLLAPLESAGDTFQLCIASKGEDAIANIIKTRARRTLGHQRSRAIREFFIG